jgi:hypothetical protein
MIFTEYENVYRSNPAKTTRPHFGAAREALSCARRGTPVRVTDRKPPQP